jgi:hypothetical protein
MCAEASTVSRAVAADFFFNCWYVEIPPDNRIRHVPRCVHIMRKAFDKAIPVTGRGGVQGSEMLRIPPFLDNRLTYGAEVVNLTLRPLLAPRNILGTYFC